jgi:ACS family hexuronate transporter-like MFS transporter
MDRHEAPEPSEKVGRYRWVIVTLLFAAMEIGRAHV